MALRTIRAASHVHPPLSVPVPRHINPSLLDPIPTFYNFPRPSLAMERRTRTRVVLPSVLMRSGTSKGLFLHQKDLPRAKSEWGNILLAAMGSRDGDLRQLDGVGGATSTTSKVAVVSKSNKPGIDVEYTFVQIGVGSDKVDFTGNCGNICSGVGPFALDEGLVVPEPGQTEIDVTIFNTNTSSRIVQRLQVGSDGRFYEEGDFRIGGVKGTASKIKVTFLDPAGSMTNKLFPSGSRQEEISVSSKLGDITVRVSLIDVANPFVFVDIATMPQSWRTLDRNDPVALELIEAIRCAAAVKMGLAKDEDSAHLVRGTPKIAVLSPVNGMLENSKKPANIYVTPFSMGKMHPSFQLTGAVCLGAAVSIPGTIASDIATQQVGITPPGTPPQNSADEAEEPGKSQKIEQNVTIEHASGDIGADVTLRAGTDGEMAVEGVAVFRTARRLFEGNVLVSI